ncbi:SRPBCC domain-containing protein [Paeniglutamicibacter sp. NPDC012692]|uniref:SRPBCC domain-containing protein n=1 Tax=Paeniglutamicibacter sp. NPDC012692 TaxID=3364388 RepID=UPI0036858DEA
MTEAHGGVEIWFRTGARSIVIELDSEYDIPDIWEASTTAEGLRAWVGILRGNTDRGDLRFAFLEEGLEAAAGSVQVLRCRPPYYFFVTVETEQGAWVLGMELSGRPGTKKVTFIHELGPTDDPSTIGPGWEYYLQRLLVHLEGGDVESVRWDDFYPALAPAYAKAPE